VREPVDANVRALLREAGIAFSRVGGVGAARLQEALRLVDQHRRIDR
jgi:hypothetical protein